MLFAPVTKGRKMTRDPLDIIYIVEARGELDTEWGFFSEVHRSRQDAREFAWKKRDEETYPGLHYRVVRYKRGCVVR
jgi:hypothetical protein